jgi:hypothetical protein
VVRDIGTPQTGANQSIVSAVTNPTGTITTSTLSSIGYSLDFLVGFATDHPALGHSNQYSWGIIGAYGATTPLSAAVASSAYTVPKLGTQECAELQSRFTGQSAYNMGYGTALIAGPVGTTGTTSTACLVNTSNSTDTAVTTLAFAGENRASFLQKWEGGIRTTFRTYSKAGQVTCDSENPCQRGIVDFTVGQDAAVTGGQVHDFVGKLDGVQPLPFTKGVLYLFGTAAIRFERTPSLPPLILTTASASSLTGSSGIPNAAIFVEPYKQPNKDFYRIGVGLSLADIINAVKPSSAKAQATKTPQAATDSSTD